LLARDDLSRRTYAAQLTAMDDEIGKVVAALEARGMRQNTLIVFHSDNGRRLAAASQVLQQVSQEIAKNDPFCRGLI